jgi:hypothetical protein
MVFEFVLVEILYLDGLPNCIIIYWVRRKFFLERICVYTLV